MSKLQDLRQKIAASEEQLSDLKAQYYAECFSALGINPTTKETMLATIIMVEELVEFSKHCVKQFEEQNQ